MFNYKLHINSDTSIIIEFEDAISIELTRFILGVKKTIEHASLESFIEAVPAYNSLLIIFEALSFNADVQLKALDELTKESQSLLKQELQQELRQETKHHLIPVCYDESLALDLKNVAAHCGLTVEEVIKLHSHQDYPVFMLGFLPGFLYLGDLNPKLHCPRRDEPRVKITAGSVGIGGSQTGIYPIDSPGGWQIIGQTPLTIFDPSKQPPSIAEPLDIVRFKPITLEEFEQYER